MRIKKKKTLIIPVITYGIESWPFKRKAENMLHIFEGMILRIIYGQIRKNGAWSTPCGGGIEYIHRDPASRRTRRKGKSQI
jgi:hypothetical protein